MRRRLAALTMLALVTAACSGESAESPTEPVPAVACEEPEEVTETSGLAMVVDPNPAVAREVVRLTVARGELPDSTVVGVDAWWQCWDGSSWVTTHVVYRGFGDNAGESIPVNSSFQIHIPDIRLALDAGYPIVIPDVEPGTYRIADEVFLGEDMVDGFVIVDVVAG